MVAMTTILLTSTTMIPTPESKFSTPEAKIESNSSITPTNEKDKPLTAIIPSREISADEIQKVKQAITIDGVDYLKKPVNIIATAYTASKEETGKTDGITASGLRASRGRTIATPYSIPFGTKIYIPDLILDKDNNGVYTAEDRGNTRYIKWINSDTMRIDVFMNTKSEAVEFGVKHYTGYILERVN